MGKAGPFVETVERTPRLLNRPIRNREVVKGLFIITDLATGGAETMLFRLLAQLDRDRYAPTVISVKDSAGTPGERIRNLGIPVHSLNCESARAGLAAVLTLKRLVTSFQPHFIQGWMYHGNIAAEVARLTANRGTPVVWNIRHSLHAPDADKPSTKALVRLLARLSSRPERIVYNSRTSAQHHERIGYDARRTFVVPNGFDCSVFRPRPESRRALRSSLGLKEDVVLIGLIARVHPVKDHDTFLRAARSLVSQGSPAHFLLVGKDTASRDMIARIQDLGLTGKVHTLDERSDIPELTAGLDVATCCSRSEAFPNVVGEAMACAVPCVASDVGDCRHIVDGTGLIVPCDDPFGLSQAWRVLLELDSERRRELGEAARRRILREFSLGQVVSRYERLYAEVVQSRRG